jgi:hypothetical protein
MRLTFLFSLARTSVAFSRLGCSINVDENSLFKYVKTAINLGKSNLIKFKN